MRTGMRVVIRIPSCICVRRCSFNVSVHVYVYVSMKVGMQVSKYVCMCVCMYVCIYVCLYVCKMHACMSQCVCLCLLWVLNFGASFHVLGLAACYFWRVSRSCTARLFALPKLAHRGTERTSQAHGQASSAAVGERPSLSSPLLVSPSQYHFGH